jgi:hypothetical protein
METLCHMKALSEREEVRKRHDQGPTCDYAHIVLLSLTLLL